MATKQKRSAETILTNSPKYSHQLMGAIERANQEAEGQIRTMRHALEEHLKIKLGSAWAIVAWMVRHAGWIITHFLLKVDGRTPFMRLRRRPFNGEIAEFGAMVWWKDPALMHAKLDDRWNSGIWLGWFPLRPQG